MRRTLTSICLWIAGILFFMLASVILIITVTNFSRQTTYRVIRRLFAVLIRIMGITLTVEGQENLEPGKTYLIMGNHQSLFDVFVIPVAVPVPFVGVEADYHFRLPVWGGLIRIWGNIPIQRHNLEKAIASISLAEERLKGGLCIGVLPEGHRTLTGHVGEFKKGAFFMALNAGADILPLGVSGLFDYCPKGSLMLAPGRVHVAIGKPIPYQDFKGMDLDKLRDLLRKTIMVLARDSD
ncbi:MAG: lysophospholipid acyltransferase family protein [Pseudomonadota bacterium]